jgi:hypothetical protein
MNTAPLLSTLCIALFFHVLPSHSIRPDEAMKKKSEHAQAIFKYLALGDLHKVKTEAEAIEKLFTDEGFEGRSDKYVEYGKELLRIVKNLKETAEKKNFAGSYYEFSRMSAVCFSCHEHLRDKNSEGR